MDSFSEGHAFQLSTPPKANIAPENRPSQKETSLPFSGAVSVSGSV